MPLVSVVIPVYNITRRFALFEQCIASIGLQTFRDVELVVVDDSSSDDSFARVEAFLRGRTSLPHKVLRTEVNAGPCIARNLGIDRSVGKHIAFLDWDDLYLPDFLQDAVRALEELSAAWVLAPAYFYREADGQVRVYTVPFDPQINVMPFYRHCAFFVDKNFPTAMGSALVCSRAALDGPPAVRFDPHLSRLTGEDVLFGYAMLKAGHRAHVLEKVGAVHRGFLGSESRSTAAFKRLDELAVSDYIEKQASDALIEMTRREDPALAAHLDRRKASHRNGFQLKRYVLAGDLLGAAATIATEPRLAKVTVLYLLNKHSSVPGFTAFLRWLEFRRVPDDPVAKAAVLALLQQLSTASARG